MLAKRLLLLHKDQASQAVFFNHLLQLIRLRTTKSNQELEYQATDFIRALSLLSKNGVPAAVAITWLCPRMSGRIGEILKEAASDLQLGADLEELIASWEKLPSNTLTELSQKLRVSLERGTPVAQQLDQLAQTAIGNSHAFLLRKAGSNETKMLIPTIFLILPITILFTIYPSLSLLNLEL
jgi:tight adherence protein C